MKLRRVRVQNYRSIRDTGWFELDEAKTILVGPNEGGKTALLRAMEQLNPGRVVTPLDPLRDFPRGQYSWIKSGTVAPADVVVVEGEYEIDEDALAAAGATSPASASTRYYRAVHLDNSVTDGLRHGSPEGAAGALVAALRGAAAHVDSLAQPPEAAPGGAGPAALELERLLATAGEPGTISPATAGALGQWVETAVAPRLDPANETEMGQLTALRAQVGAAQGVVHGDDRLLEECRSRIPVMVYVSTYPSVTPLIHLGHLADAIDADAVEPDDEYFFGNLCLLSLLGFSARELSDMGKVQDPTSGDGEAFEQYRRTLDERDAVLNTASLRLTTNIRAVWGADDDEGRQYTIRIVADQQYLKVVVEDSLGVQIELDQRSQGFKWLVSFFVVFFAQAAEASGQAVLLLDEPGLSLHGLKQRQFRHTLSRLGTSNQLVFTTHSPYMVGPEELDRVRVVELADPAKGTQVHSDLSAEDPAALLPLQEAVAFELAGSLFGGRKSLVVESLAESWYIQATAALLEEAGMAALDPEIEIVPVQALSRMVHFATVLRAEGHRVAVVVGADDAPERAAQRARLGEVLGDKQLLSAADGYEGPVARPGIEDMLHHTLVSVGRTLGWDAGPQADQGWGARPVVRSLADAAGPSFSASLLAKAYLAWARDHGAGDLSAEERVAWMKFVEKVNQALA